MHTLIFMWFYRSKLANIFNDSCVSIDFPSSNKISIYLFNKEIYQIYTIETAQSPVLKVKRKKLIHSAPSYLVMIQASPANKLAKCDAHLHTLSQDIIEKR